MKVRVSYTLVAKPLFQYSGMRSYANTCRLVGPPPGLMRAMLATLT